MTFLELHCRLGEYVAAKVRRGELTERGLARRTGISQPHLHNVLKGKRFFSWQSADVVLNELGLSVIDLMKRSDETGAPQP
jgi:transcriptional regulator with XRE-family HTH domain